MFIYFWNKFCNSFTVDVPDHRLVMQAQNIPHKPVEDFVKFAKIPWSLHFPPWLFGRFKLIIFSPVDSVPLQKMLIYDPAKRISAKAALKHSYFADLDLSKLPARYEPLAPSFWAHSSCPFGRYTKVTMNATLPIQFPDAFSQETLRR